MRSFRRAGSEPALRAELSDGLTAVPFSASYIAHAPEASGVYFLYHRNRLLYIGIAVHGTSIRHELQKHFTGTGDPRMRMANAFDFEVTRDPVVVSRDYLAAHMARHRGRVPPCNRSEPLWAAMHPPVPQVDGDRAGSA